MNKSELIKTLAETKDLHIDEAADIVNAFVDSVKQALINEDRIEIRGFGSFSLHYRAPRVGRNPKTGESVRLDGKFVPHFKPGKELRDRVNEPE